MIKKNNRRKLNESNVVRKNKNINEGKVVTKNGVTYQYLKENAESDELVDTIESLYADAIATVARNAKVNANGSFAAKGAIKTKVDLSDAAYDLDILDETVEMGEEQDPIAVTISKNGTVTVADDNFTSHLGVAMNLYSDASEDFPGTAVTTIYPNGRVEISGSVEMKQLTLYTLLSLGE